MEDSLGSEAIGLVFVLAGGAGSGEEYRVRERLRAVAAETVEIATRGCYLTGEGHRVDVGDLVAAAVADTRLALDNATFLMRSTGSSPSQIESG